MLRFKISLTNDEQLDFFQVKEIYDNDSKFVSIKEIIYMEVMKKYDVIFSDRGLIGIVENVDNQKDDLEIIIKFISISPNETHYFRYVTRDDVFIKLDETIDKITDINENKVRDIFKKLLQ